MYFRKLFREQYGLSPKQYLQQIRMEKAEELLQSNLFSVTVIAEKTGFSSVYHFCRAFKNYTGFTPLEYQKHASGPLSATELI
ncbi:MAG TPA: helix-turn-helix transcriptional regulator [Armatimonadota bacterium]|nr:helix-turn-helix transcriptional regulator [Armatimonadota bacterium]